MVTVEIIEVARTCPDEDGKMFWYSFRITNDDPGGKMELGFEPTKERLEERWGFERDVFVEEWSKPYVPRQTVGVLSRAARRNKVQDVG